MKQEIQKILDDATTGYEGGTDFDQDKATIQLQRLFLSKQVELLNELHKGKGWVQISNDLADLLKKLESELKQLE